MLQQLLARSTVCLVLVCTLALAPSIEAQTFVDRLQPDDLRVVSYNVLWDTIFPSQNPTQAAKFVRVVAALDADIWCLQEINYNTQLSAVLSLFNSIAPIPGGWHGHKEGDCVIMSRWPLSMKATNTVPAGDKGQAMALVDLPDDVFEQDLYVMNNHYKCCGGFDDRRQKQSDSIINWMRDARTPGGSINLPAGTAMMVIGDLNIVDGFQPVQTLIDGNIINEGIYGPDSKPDWDASDSTDELPMHNQLGPATWTWYSPGPYPHGRLDFVISTDSVLPSVHRYVLNTTTMSASDLAANGLLANDITVDSQGVDFDHLPLVVDFRGSSSPFTLLGGGVAGWFGVPSLTASGSLAGGSGLTVTLGSALPGSSTTLVFGLNLLSFPLKGGLLIPSPDVIVPGLQVDANGNNAITSTWPTGIPGGIAFYLQHWVQDATAPFGAAGSNGVQGVTP